MDSTGNSWVIKVDGQEGFIPRCVMDLLEEHFAFRKFRFIGRCQSTCMSNNDTTFGMKPDKRGVTQVYNREIVDHSRKTLKALRL